MEINALTLSVRGTIKNALNILDETGLGTAFITDDENKLVGILTDGDIRRALLDNNSLKTAVSSVMNTNFVSLPVETENTIILQNISEKVKLIPLIDAENRLIDYASATKIRRISVAAPVLGGNELAYVTDCIKTSWISSQGKYVRQFEELFSSYHDGYPALAVSNGTVALHLALEALGIGKGDEVLVADLTFAASVNAVIYTGATPVLVDIRPDTWNLSIESATARISSKTKAIMAVHLYGHPCDMDAIMQLAQKYNLLVIEDCAEALGSYYHEKPVGTFGDVATFSFYGNKTITTGEGGMVVFRDPAIAERAATLRDHGMKKTRRYWHEEVGYNYRLTNVQAAIGVAQFERLDEFIKAKRRIAQIYNETLAGFSYFQLPAELPGCVNSYWLYTCMVMPGSPFSRDQLITHLGNCGVETRPVFYPMHIMPPYTNFGRADELKVSKAKSECGISLPSSVNLTEVELAYICTCLTNFVKKHQ